MEHLYIFYRKTLKMPHLSKPNATVRQAECHTWCVFECGIWFTEMWHLACLSVAFERAKYGISTAEKCAFSCFFWRKVHEQRSFLMHFLPKKRHFSLRIKRDNKLIFRILTKIKCIFSFLYILYNNNSNKRKRKNCCWWRWR